MATKKARCETCCRLFSVTNGDLYTNEDEGVQLCIPNGCYSRYFETKQQEEINAGLSKLWYVGACEPGRDNRVRRELLDLAKELEIPSSVVSRVILPKKKEWRTTKTSYKVYEYDREHVLGFVTADSEEEAIYNAKKKFEGRGKKKNPLWRQVGKVILDRKGGQLIQRRVLTYPGYIIINMIYNEQTKTLMEKMQRKGLWGLLPLRMPVVRKDIKTGRAVSKAMNKMELEDKLYWKPTELKSEEEAIMLIRDKLVKNKDVEPEKPKEITIGDTVKIINGPLRGAEGKVLMKGAGKNPEVIVNVSILGKDTPSKCLWWQVMKVN